MEPSAIFASAFLVGFSGAIMPGPLTAVLAEHSLKKGFKASPLITLGHGLLELVLVVLLAVGLGAYLAHEYVTIFIGVADGGVLAWMGYGMVRSALEGNLSLQGAADTAEKSGGSVGAGVLATLSNPYWFLWWGTVGAGYVTLSYEHGFQGILAFFGGHVLSDFVWLSVLAIALVSGKRLITDRVYTGIVVVLGWFIIGMACYFFWTGFNFLL